MSQTTTVPARGAARTSGTVRIVGTGLLGASIGHALTALGYHITRHQLPTPGDITVESDHIEVALDRRDARAWKRSLADGVNIKREAAIRGSRTEQVTLIGQLPDSGVRVHLTFLRTTRHVQGVSA